MTGRVQAIAQQAPISRNDSFGPNEPSSRAGRVYSTSVMVPPPLNLLALTEIRGSASSLKPLSAVPPHLKNFNSMSCDYHGSSDQIRAQGSYTESCDFNDGR